MKTILIADDKPTGRELLRAVLESEGHEVLEAVDGQDALEQARHNHPDFIVLDLHMPKLTGIEVIAELRRQPEFDSTPIVALTASAMNGDRELAMAAGFTGYITKPIRMSDLRSQLALLLKEPCAAS